jgi:hypothetical protein
MSKTKTVMLTLRIPAPLRVALRNSVKTEHRSVNSLVVAMLWNKIEEAPSAQQRRS